MPADAGRPYETEAGFLAAPEGERFVLIRRPAGGALRGTVMLVPPLAEEMNKGRRMFAEAARALAAAGWQVVQVDLHGCGDSDGEFGDATWSGWIEDLTRAEQAYAGAGELWFWGVRAGALLIAPMLARRPDANLLLWQPAIDGAMTLDQLLRLRTAAAVVGNENGADRKALRERLMRGAAVEVGGYQVSPRLAEGLREARLALAANFTGRVVWIDVVASVHDSARMAATRMVDAWRRGGHTVDFTTVQGAPFWQTVETVEVPELIDATQRALAGVAAAPHATVPCSPR